MKYLFILLIAISFQLSTYAQFEFQVGYEAFKPTDNTENAINTPEVKLAGSIWNQRDVLLGDSLSFPINSSFPFGSNAANGAFTIEVSYAFDNNIKVSANFRNKGRYNANGFSVVGDAMYQLRLFEDLIYDEFKIFVSGGLGVSFDQSFPRNLWDAGFEKHVRDQFLNHGYSDHYYNEGESPADGYIQAIDDAMSSKVESRFGTQGKLAAEGSYHLYDTGLFARLRAVYQHDALRHDSRGMTGFSFLLAIGYVFQG